MEHRSPLDGRRGRGVATDGTELAALFLEIRLVCRRFFYVVSMDDSVALVALAPFASSQRLPFRTRSRRLRNLSQDGS